MYGSNIGKAIGGMLLFLGIAGLVVGALIVGSIWFFTHDNNIESKKPITPEIKLTTDGKVVDTIYVYKKP